MSLSFVGNLSGGTGSWAACKLIADRHGADRLTLLFADTIIEDADLYRFLLEGAANIYGIDPPAGLMRRSLALPGIGRDEIADRKAELAAIRTEAVTYFGGRLVWLADGRTPFEVFRDVRFLGNSRVDPCSKHLKRKPLDEWMEANCARPTKRCVVGLGWWERHRFEGQWTTKVVGGERKREWKPGLRERMAEKGWTFEAPLIDHKPTMDRADLSAWLDREGIDPPALTEEGFAHNNCGGGCVKGGQDHWLRLYGKRPATFSVWEFEETDLRTELGNVAMLADRKGGKKVPLPLSEFRRRVDAGEECDLFGGAPCGCFAGDTEDN